MEAAKMVLAEEERVVDPQLGYPLGYARLCRMQVHDHGVFTPFTAGPPYCFLPYSPQSEDFAALKEWDGLFPTVAETDRDPQSSAQKFTDELWQQLDHLGNAGFDPAKFRVDSYGNVLYRNADPASPLAWEIDHWFPHSRGGKTVVPNLRVVQWQANQRKKNRLEFLVPWWDLQHGCSINQFLSAFASKNADFRKRSFALFFSGGEDESVAREHVGDCRPWPQQFREKKAQCGLAAAAIVMVRKETEEVARRPCHVPLKPLPVCDPGVQSMRRWSTEEEEALRRAVTKYGSVSCWNTMKENEPALANRSPLQLKEKWRVMRLDWQKLGKENMAVNCKSDHMDRHSSLQKELRVKVIREQETQEKETELAELERTATTLKQQNEKERLHAVELEAVLTKHKRRVEKQRRWAETQSSYRLCLERMIRDTMHQSISYKEQARLNQSACNALKARLDCQKAVCEVAEKDLVQNYAQRGALEAAAGGLEESSVKGAVVQGRDIVDVSSCMEDDQEEDKKIQESDSEDDLTADEVYSRRTEHRRTQDQPCTWKSPLDGKVTTVVKVEKHEDVDDALVMEMENTASKQAEVDVSQEHVNREEGDDTDVGSSNVAADPESLPVVHDHVDDAVSKLSDLNQVQKNVIVVQSENEKLEANVYKEEYLDELLQHVQFQLPSPHVDDSPLRKSEEHLDELLQQVLATHIERIKKSEAGKQQASDTDDEKVRQIGKQNLDKWLQVLLFNVESTAPGQASPLHRALSPALTQMSIAAMRGSLNLEAHQDQELTKKTASELSVERPKGLWGVLLRKLSARQQSEQCLSTKLDADSENDSVEVASHDNETGTLRDVIASKNHVQATEPDHSTPLDEHVAVERKVFPRALSDVDEISEAESFNSTDTSQLENKTGLRASIKAAGLVWKKAVKKLETRLQDGNDSHIVHNSQAL